MNELLEKSGFKLTSACSCGGTFRQTFRKNVNLKWYEVIIMPNRKRFEIRLNYKVIDKGTEADLEQKLIDNEII